jgi:argininosuccinate lyase
MQLIKEIIIPVFDDILECLKIAEFMVSNIEVKKNILDDPKFNLLFSVENVNDLVVKGMPFRDAYREIGGQIEKGEVVPNKDIHHTLEGSIGNLCNDHIQTMMDKTIASFNFSKVHEAYEKLLNWKTGGDEK